MNIQNIQNIQITQGLIRAVEGKSGSGKGKNLAESNYSLADATLSEAGMKTVSNNSNAIDRLIYPPLFPLGHTQGIYEVVANSDNSSDNSLETKKVRGKKDNTAKKEDVPSQQAASVADSMIKSKSNVAAKNGTSNTGSFLDLKV